MDSQWTTLTITLSNFNLCCAHNNNISGQMGKMKGATCISIEWRREQRQFVVNSEEAMADQFPATELPSSQSNFYPQGDEDSRAIDQELNNLISRLEDTFNSEASSAIAEMPPIRTQILTMILNTHTPLRWLPAFLQKWQDLLTSLDESTLTSIDCVDYCQELMALAGGWKIIGDIANARSTLGKCFQVLRQHLKIPFADPEQLEDYDSRGLRATAIAAKKLLLDCVAFQIATARNKTLLERQAAPALVQASLSKEFWMLLRKAPLSVEIACFLAQNLMKQRQFALVMRFLDHSPFYGEDTALTLIHARALAFGGFYRQSIAISESFPQHAREVNTTATEALQIYCDQLKKLLASREKADDCLRLEEYAEAAKGYEECLTMVDPADHKQISALLFGHANALLELGHLSKATNDLRKSVQLNPANKIAFVRLQTACLQLETERIKNELSQNKAGKKAYTRSLWQAV